MPAAISTFTTARRALATALGIALALALPAAAGAATTDQVGEWGPLMDFGVPGTHEALMHNGKVLYWRTSEEARVWDPATDEFLAANYNPDSVQRGKAICKRDLQQKLVKDGWRCRVYIPFGTEWYPYFMRRLAERPANALFILRNLLR